MHPIVPRCSLAGLILAATGFLAAAPVFAQHVALYDLIGQVIALNPASSALPGVERAGFGPGQYTLQLTITQVPEPRPLDLASSWRWRRAEGGRW